MRIQQAYCCSTELRQFGGFFSQKRFGRFFNLKVLTNEKRGGLAVVPFDRSRFKLFSRKFSNKLVQAPFCERPITALQALFLSFAINNCFPMTDEKLLAVFELVFGDFL